MKQKSKLIRNLKPGDIIQVTDATRWPIRNPVRVTVTHVQETRSGMITGRRMWQASFTPAQMHGSWACITGYSDDRVDVYV